MKPGVSFALIGTFLIFLLNSKSVSNVSVSVSSVRITSTSFITGTGLKKWRPPNFFLRSGGHSSLISLISSPEVFDAKMQEGLGSA